MNKYLKISPLFAIIMLHTACSTVKYPEKTVKLNTTEYNRLVAEAKNTFLSMPDSKIPKADKRYIKQNSPEFRVRYTGYKKGKYTIKWETPSEKILQVFGEGNMLDFSASFEKITIVSINVNNPTTQ